MKRVALFAALTCLFALWQFPGVTRADDALAQANAERAARGLPPFQADPGLAAAAEAAAQYRASYGITGHTGNDFAFLPAGVSSPAAGCAAWPDGMGFGACALYENWTYAGAASVRGRNGLIFHHLFVSHQASVVRGKPAKSSPPAWEWKALDYGGAELYHGGRLLGVYVGGKFYGRGYGGWVEGPIPDGSPPYQSTPPVTAPAPVAQSACAGGSCQGGDGATSGRLVIRFGEWPLGHAVANRVTHPFGGRFRR